MAQETLSAEVREQGETLRNDERQELGAARQLPDGFTDGQRYRHESCQPHTDRCAKPHRARRTIHQWRVPRQLQLH